MSTKYRIGIGLLGKGSTNHLHLRQVVEAFRGKAVEPVYIVRADYFDVLEKMSGVDYRKVSISRPSGIKGRIIDSLQSIRKLYPSYDKGRSVDTPAIKGLSLIGQAVLLVKRFLARSLLSAEFAVWLEGRLYGPECVAGISAGDFDQLLLLGIGAVNSELEGQLSWWAKYHDIPLVHYIGNYDSLSSKGFRGITVKRLLVWGPSMREDAETLQHIDGSKITAIGSLRYNNALMPHLDTDRSRFLVSVGLDPAKKTLLYAGFVIEHSYFEILEIYQHLLATRGDVQLIIRLYPNKDLMGSSFVPAMIGYAKTLPNVFISLADPHYKKGERGREVLHIEEYELVNALAHCDVVINQFSTISIEACLFEKPVINMWYLPKPPRILKEKPEYFEFHNLYHTRRMLSYGAVPLAQNRGEVIDLIIDALDNPVRRQAERKNVVEKEIGQVDGKALDRLVDICIKEYECH